MNAASTELPAETDVCVVGAGIIGLATAYELARRGRRVAVLDAQAPGRAASWAGGGILSPLPPDDWPEPLTPLIEDSLRRYLGWCAALQAETGVDPEYWRCGARYVTDAGVRDYPELAQVRNPRLLRALLAALAGRGVPVIGHTPAIGWERRGTTLAGVRTSRGLLRCERAVVTAGAWTGTLIDVDVRPVKGQMLLFEAGAVAPDRMLIGSRAYVIPRRDGRVLVGSTLEEAGFDTHPTEAARRFLLDQGAALWPQLRQLDVLRQWSGLRPQVAGGGDRLAMGPVQGLQGLYVCTGHFRIGITLAPGSAHSIADQMTGESPSHESNRLS